MQNTNFLSEIQTLMQHIDLICNGGISPVVNFKMITNEENNLLSKLILVRNKLVILGKS